MIDVMTRLKVHNMSEGGAPQAAIAVGCGVGVRSVQRIVTEPVPTAADVVAGHLSGAAVRGRPPKADASVVERVRQVLAAEPLLPTVEVLRRSRPWRAP